MSLLPVKQIAKCGVGSIIFYLSDPTGTCVSSIFYILSPRQAMNRAFFLFSRGLLYGRQKGISIGNGVGGGSGAAIAALLIRFIQRSNRSNKTQVAR
jgi:hypothetical protein